jgi:threonylcarbamoyladenosine tRNA methylthiotransferase MtaB
MYCVFPFSRCPGAPVAEIADHVPGDVVRERAATIRALGEEKNWAFVAAFIGRSLEVVAEGRYKGLSLNYLSVFFVGAEGLEGKRMEFRVVGASPTGLEGRLEEL